MSAPVPTRRSAILRTMAFVGFFVSWAIYYAVTQSTQALHNNLTEAYVWGREFQLGYNQHPPFWAWIAGAWFLVFPRATWSFAVLSALNSAVGLWGSWRLIGRFAKGPKQVAAIALLLLTPLYTFQAFKYNANSIFISIWPWTIYFFLRSMEKRKRIDALMFGVAMGVALLSKYFALVLAATCLLAALQHPNRRRYFTSASPYLSIAVTAAILAPHVVWLVRSGAPPLRYLNHVSHLGLATALNNIQATFFGCVANFLVVAAIVVWSAGLAAGRIAPTIRANFARPETRLLATLALAPLFLAILACLILQSELVAAMLVGTFSLLPLLLIECLGACDIERLSRVCVLLAAALTASALIASPLAAVGMARWSTNAVNIEPRKELAAAATEFWREKTALPLLYVAGSGFYDDALAFYSEERPHSFGNFDYFRHPWVKPEDIERHGLLSLCVADDAQCQAATTRFATPETSQTEMTLAHSAFGRTAKSVTFIVTVIPPRR